MRVDIKADRYLDASGLCCPMPMIRVNEAIHVVAVGEVIELVATDPASRNDIPSWCERTGHALLSAGFDSDSYQYRYFIRKTTSADA